MTLAGLLVAAVLSTVLLANTDKGTGPDDLSADFTPSAGSVVPSDDVRDELVEAIERLLAEPFVSIESVGFTEGRRSDIEASVDVAGQRMSSREVISERVEVGSPKSADHLVSEVVVLGDEAWLRILQPGQDANTPFQFIDASGTNHLYLQGAYTQLGRVFDSLSVLALLLTTTPFEAELLKPRTVDGDALDGARATFSSEEVAEFLEANELATTDHHSTETTTFEFWYDPSGLRQLVATGTQFQNGEALETSARISYRVESTLSVDAPRNTLPR